MTGLYGNVSSTISHTCWAVIPAQWYPSVRKLREALDRRQEMDLLQYSYQQDRSFDALEKAAQDLGAGGGAAGLGVGTALGSVLSGLVKEAVQPAPAGQSAGFAAAAARRCPSGTLSDPNAGSGQPQRSFAVPFVRPSHSRGAGSAANAASRWDKFEQIKMLDEFIVRHFRL